MKLEPVAYIYKESSPETGEFVFSKQADQEPAVYRVWDRISGISYRRTKPSESEYVEWDALYAAPVRTKDLTDDEIRDAFYSCGFGAIVVDGCRAVIARFKEKNK